MRKTKKILAMVLMVTLLVTIFTFVTATNALAATLVWDTAAGLGTWTATGNDVAAVSDTANYIKYVTTTSIGGINTVNDLTFSAKVYTGGDLSYTSGGSNGDGFYFSLRDSGAAGNYGGITFMFDAGTKRVSIRNGSTILADYGNGYFDDAQFVIDAQGYVDVSVTLVGNKMTSLKFGGVEVSGIIITGQTPYVGNIGDLVLPVTTAGRISVGSFTGPPTYIAAVKNVSVTVLDPAVTPSPTLSASPTIAPTTSVSPTIAPTTSVSSTVAPTASIKGIVWQGVAGTWTQSGDDISAIGTTTDYWKLASTTSIDGLSTVKDLKLTAMIYIGGDLSYVAGGQNGDGFFFVLRDQGTTVIATTGQPAYNGLVFLFDAGTKRMTIKNGGTTIADYGYSYFDDTQFAIDAQGYVSFSITIKGSKITSLKFGGTEVKGIAITGQSPVEGNLGDLVLPITTAGKISVGSFTNPPTFKASFKNVVVTQLDVASTGTTATPTNGDSNKSVYFFLFLMIAMASVGIVVSKKIKNNI